MTAFGKLRRSAMDVHVDISFRFPVRHDFTHSSLLHVHQGILNSTDSPVLLLMSLMQSNEVGRNFQLACCTWDEVDTEDILLVRPENFIFPRPSLLSPVRSPAHISPTLFFKYERR